MRHEKAEDWPRLASDAAPVTLETVASRNLVNSALLGRQVFNEDNDNV